MLGSYVSASAQSTPTPEAERFFAGLLEWAGVRLARRRHRGVDRGALPGIRW